ncbi:MAG: hypothetical protein R2828_08740 [Saprospiraceae bacterium]
MSYDLYFYKQKDCKTTDSDIRNYLGERFQKTDNSDQYWYENKETGVYFSFEYDKPDPDDEPLEGFEDYDSTDWMFNINFLRPQFFGLEAFPFVERFINDLDLIVFNPQVGGEEMPIKYTHKDLFENWSNINARNSSEYFKEYELFYLDLDKSNKSWDFNLNRLELQDKLGEMTFVPGIFYFKEHKTGLISTLCVWPEHISTIIPVVDYFIIQKKIKKLFGKKESSGLVSYETIRNTFGDFITNENGYELISPANSLKIEKLFNGLEYYCDFKDFGEGMTVDKIVNYKPD